MEEKSLQPPPPMAKRIALLMGVVLLGILGVFFFGRLTEALGEQAEIERQRQEAAEAAGSATEVVVVRPEAAETAPFVVLTGTLEPNQAADLSFGVPGRVATVAVGLGDQVERGDVLVSLDRASIGVASAQSNAAIQVAEANAAMARDRVAMLEPLVERGGVARRDLTTARQQLTISEAQLVQARAGRRQVAASSADHNLRAPFDGVVTRVPSGVGVAANPGQPLARVEDLSSLRLRTTVNRRELELIEVGMEASIVGVGVSGELVAVVRSLDAQTRRAPVEVQVANADGSLVANAYVRARVSVGHTREALRLPATARRPDGSVLVIGEDSRIEMREITADAEDDGSWLVTDGLSPEDRVVVRPALVHEGRVVVPVESDDGPPTRAALEP